MPRSRRVAPVVLLTGAMVLMMGFGGCPGPTPPPPNPLTLLPSDPNPSCVVPSTLFATWFQTPGTPIPAPVNTVFAPANSVSFPNSPNRSFYQWAMQDFLWLTSPAPATYGGGGGLIMDSPTFYDVSPPSGPSGSRTLLPHSAGFIRPFALRSAQADAQGLQLVFDTSGTPIQVMRAPMKGPLTVLSVTGQKIKVAHARREDNGKPILLDASGHVIQVALTRGIKPEARAAKDQIPTMITAQKFIIDGIPIFIDPALEVIDVEQGEADNGVVEAQLSSGGSLVYYATIVNDVYAYYATGANEKPTPGIVLGGDGICTPSSTNPCFPTNGTQLSQITTFASAHGKTFPDANALAIEIKSAWVVAAGLPNESSYITMEATIPTYTPSAPPPAGTATMTATGGQQTVKLALVGMHVVGSAAGHPEMLWSTFEHVANAPRDVYSYVNASSSTVAVPVSVSTLPTIAGSSAPWLFSSAAAGNNDKNFNAQNMTYNGSLTPPPQPTITALSPSPSITPSNTMRWKPFGAASDIPPNPIDPSIAASNTEIIAINNSVEGMLTSGDVRLNYVMSGVTWTIGGAAPNAFIGGNQVGTSSLSNVTMETYEQGSPSNPTVQSGGTNCLSCHTSNTTNVSHVFGAIKPLF
jgi:hypothetical protein